MYQKIVTQIFKDLVTLMNYKTFLLICLAYFITAQLFGQNETYIVKKESFSTDKYDEFAPVYYKKGIVFCSNRPSNIVSNYSTEQNKGLIKIYYSDTPGKAGMENTKLFSKNLKTKFNDGPVTFNSKGDTIFYSRNLKIEGKLSELSSARNRLGIFTAVFDGNDWTNIKELRINNEWYNITTPWISPDGNKLYFASDKPGGYGGLDLYYSIWKDGYWNDPVNLGPVINTNGNESYPFINADGDLFFSSDGHPGLGGKDIFFSRFSDSTWLSPVHLDAPINSEYDDFGLITDTLMNSGYFASNRDKSIDIYSFRTIFPQVFYINIQKENQDCFIFNDNGSIVIDTNNLQLKWSFGDNSSANGSVVKHCFAGTGMFKVTLDIIDKSTGKIFFRKLSYNLELRNFTQPYINSPDVAIKGNSVEFDGKKSCFPGFKILSYSWDFGDKSQSSGENVTHSYNDQGDYLINLVLELKSTTSGKIEKSGIAKKIMVFNNLQERDTNQTNKDKPKTSLPDIREYANAFIKNLYSAESEIQQDVFFCIELFSSKRKIELNSPVFRYLPRKYSIRELFNSEDSTYSYTVDRQMSLMATYPASRELLALGFQDIRIRTFVLQEPAEKELYELVKKYGAAYGSYFDSSDELTSNALIMLDQIVKLLNKYPEVKLEVGVHTDNTGSAENNLVNSKALATILAKYIINRGVSEKRLFPHGFGSSKPIASNILERDRKLNRRIEFLIKN
jgi:flagellar motor protein MotB